MATKPASANFDVGAAFARAASQFRGLNSDEPGTWPLLPKATVWLLAGLVVVAAGWALLLSDASDALEAERNREPSLKADYRNKLKDAVNLPELRKKKLQVQEYVIQLERQLPGKAEMDALLSDINQAGIGRGLQFELFRPGKEEIKDYYAELPIAIRVTGRFHDIGSFAGDVANLSRIVTLHNIQIAPATAREAQGLLAMEATARTYRYLDAAEVAEAARKAAAAKAAQKK
jgi:type IV pilus assembly protein PilO